MKCKNDAKKMDRLKNLAKGNTMNCDSEEFVHIDWLSVLKDYRKKGED